MKNKIFFAIFSFLMIFLMSFSVSAYTDYALTDIVLPNTVRAGQDLNLSFIITSNSGGNIDVDINIYSPQGNSIHSATRNMSVGTNNLTFPVSGDLNFSTQPYMVRGIITEASDENPTNNIYSKYFTVAKSTDKVPVSDLPLFSGIIVALLFLFVLSYNKPLKKKK